MVPSSSSSGQNSPAATATKDCKRKNVGIKKRCKSNMVVLGVSSLLFLCIGLMLGATTTASATTMVRPLLKGPQEERRLTSTTGSANNMTVVPAENSTFASSSPFRPADRIVNGQDAVYLPPSDSSSIPQDSSATLPHVFGFHAELIKRGHRNITLCGASLISSRHVVTASHCWVAMEIFSPSGVVNLTDFQVIVGAVCRPEQDGEDEDNSCGTAYNITAFKQHPLAIRPGVNRTFGVDVALIELDVAAISTEPYKPVPLDDGSTLTRYFREGGKKIKTPRRLTYLGSGFTDADDKKSSSSVLQTVEVDYFSLSNCQDRWGKRDFRGAVICSRFNKTQVTSSHPPRMCKGDSGSALLTSEDDDSATLVGVHSFGSQPNCVYRRYLPMGAARVSVALPWIQSVVCDSIVSEAEALCQLRPVTHCEEKGRTKFTTSFLKRSHQTCRWLRHRYENVFCRSSVRAASNALWKCPVTCGTCVAADPTMV